MTSLKPQDSRAPPMDYKTLPMSPLPATQALSSTTFRPPPLDGSLTLPEIYDWHLEHNPDHPVLVYLDSQKEERTISWDKCARAVHRIANEIRRRVCKEANVKHQAPTVVAILSTADTITYFLNIAGILRAGYTVFPISPRNSPAAVAHLLQKARVTHVLVGTDDASDELFLKSHELLDESLRSSLRASQLSSFAEICSSESNTEITDAAPSVSFDLDCAALILHSSGSTAFPKPITWTHYRLIQLSWIPYFGERDMCGTRLACHSMPMYHGMGVMQTGWTATCGIIITSFEPRQPAILPSPDSVIESATDSKSDMVFCVPSFIEAWSKNDYYVSCLRRMHGILYGGGPLNQDLGDRLSNEGVSIFILYGSSEVGIISPIVPRPVKKDWNYFRLAGNIKGKFRPDGHGHHELIVIPNPYEVPCVFNAVEDDVDAYATSDLLTAHPTKPGYWKIHGRVDDQIMHSTGEKTNPGPLETTLNQDPHIISSVMFGRGRFNAGVIVDPKPNYAFDPTDEKALRKFRQLIWPTMEQMNEYAPQHSRIFKEMILVASPTKPFTYTAKNTARRQAIIEDYADDIEALYATVQITTQSDIPLPQSWSLQYTLNFTRQLVHHVMKVHVKDDADIFRHGCDSLQATWIRNTLLNAIRKSTNSNVRNVPVNFIYHNPSIASLSAYISTLAEADENSTQSDDIARRVGDMQSMAKKYSSSFKQHEPSTFFPRKDVVLITGTTGGLGCLLFVNLLKSQDIERVYALNRRGEELVRRQLNALKERGLDPSILETPKLILLSMDLAAPMFGLDSERYDEMRNNVTHIIHNAYPVNFNWVISSFEPSVAALRNIIDFALESPLPDPPRLLFTSSVSAVSHFIGAGPVPECDVKPDAATGTGYSESKWVCEEILANAARQTSLKPIVVRIGQLSGMSSGGFWNPKEWVPALIKSSVHVGCLPRLDKEISWLPIDIAAEALIEMRNSPTRILHLAHPRPVSWMAIFEPAARYLRLPLVSYEDWLRAVTSADSTSNAENSIDMAIENPAIRIIDFFRSSSEDASTSDSFEAMGLKRLSLDKALEVSLELRNAQERPLSGDDMQAWLAGWGLSRDPIT